VNEAYQGEDSRPRSDEEMEEGDILNSIEDFADYGGGKTFLSVNLNCFYAYLKKKKCLNKRCRVNCACQFMGYSIR
jgi:hypothetical protein